MRTVYQVLRGADPLQGVRVDRADLRKALEREFRGKLLRLRQGYATYAPDPARARARWGSQSAGHHPGAVAGAAHADRQAGPRDPLRARRRRPRRAVGLRRRASVARRPPSSRPRVALSGPGVRELHGGRGALRPVPRSTSARRSVMRRSLRISPSAPASTVLLIAGCGYNTIQTHRRAGQPGPGPDPDPAAAARRPDSQPGRNGEGRHQAGRHRLHLHRQCPRPPRRGRCRPATCPRWRRPTRQLTQGLGRLLAISENYPQLRSSDNFRDLQASWRAPRTGSRWPGRTTTRRWASSTRTSAASPTT